MTAVHDRPRADAGARRRAEKPKPSRAARVRVSVRIARRQVRRAWVSSLLIMSLIALPIAGMAGMAVLVSSTFSTAAERVNVELGRMSAWVEPMWPAESGFWQVPDDPYTHGNESTWGSGAMGDETGEMPTDPTNALAAGTEIVPLSSGEERVETVAGIARVKAWAGDVTDPRFVGHFALAEGRAPTDDRQVLVTPATLTRAGVGIGETLSLAGGQKFTITGTFRDAEVAADEVALAFADSDRYAPVRFYLPEADIGISQLKALNASGFGVYSRQLVLTPPPFTSPVGDDYGSPTAAEQEQQQKFALAGAIGAGGLASGYMVVLLAGAAFAVSARRQQRALAIAASVGAEPRDLRRVVLLQGAVLGLVGGCAGLGLGVGLAAVLIPVFDDGSATRFWGFHVPWLLLGGVLMFAVVVGSASAWMPARAVGKSDTISALRGARRPLTVTASRPLWGSLLILVGVALTVVSGIAAGAVAVSSTIAWDSALRWIPIVGIIGGPVLAQIGILLSGRWLLWLASRALSRVGLAARLASRDAVANGARTVPAFAAIGATVFVAVFAVSMGTMSAEQGARSYTYTAPSGTIVGDISPMSEPLLTAEVGQEAANDVERMFIASGATSTALVSAQPDIYVGAPSDLPADLDRAMLVAPEQSLLPPGEDDGRAVSYNGYPSENLSIVAVDDLETAMHVTLDPAQRADYVAGAVIVSDSRYITGGRITAASWRAREYLEGKVPSNIWRAEDGVSDPQWERTAPAIAVTAPHQGIVAAITPETARAWGVDVVPRRVLAAFPEGSEMNSNDHLYELSDGLMVEDYQVSLWRETGPGSPAVWLVPLLAAVAVLVLGASAVALGLARFERRPDDATLAAVGGTPGLRRRIGLWQGLVIAGFGTFAGAAAGILPPIGFWLQSQTAGLPLDLADIPWWLLAALAVALPLGIAAVNWLVPPREPELTRRNVIA
ncbi:ABC transporter permease [Microbacterium oleivorans]|uniref:ABC transporter permease n=1 Tax=Microbacterium oleivorans TaxID=273677 RepID=UPI00080E918B|nr:ABC transporter permease [Microbacterium oleivorans]